MFEIINGRASKGYRKKNLRQNNKILRYALMKSFHHGHWIQVYMHAFIYVGTDTI